ncbi:MAG: hypothetical protein SZ59_C0004G0022 [candidate division TM6 bacterium GW2011_GWF2_28_16]|nr:MAG: hypothetical protein SZ59_C0004G0022 [candidate division TM6 bacterium GW2011_GWF2_28_16]
MEKIEFITQEENGFLKIPQKYKQKLKNSKIKVILVIQDQNKFDKIVKKNIKKYSNALKELAHK